MPEINPGQHRSYIALLVAVSNLQMTIPNVLQTWKFDHPEKKYLEEPNFDVKTNLAPPKSAENDEELTKIFPKKISIFFVRKEFGFGNRFS